VRSSLWLRKSSPQSGPRKPGSHNRENAVSVRKLAAVLIAMSILGSVDRVEADGFTYTDFSSTTGLNLVTDAASSGSVPGSVLQLNPDTPWKVGAAWYSTKQAVAGGFETTFDFRIEVPTGTDGADGFAFLVQNMGDSAIGTADGDYYGRIMHSIAVEFDTFYNTTSNDANGNANHISVHTAYMGENGHLESLSIGRETDIPNLSDGTVHSVRILYQPGTMTIWMDEDVGPANLPLVVNVDLNDLGLEAGTAFVGFAGGTGAHYETHDILNWTFSPIPEPSTYAALVSMGLMGLAIAWRRRKRAA